MKTTCTNCRRKFQQSEAYENTYELPALCVRCALIGLTVDDDPDQEPDWFDIENAWSRSGEATPEELDEIAEEHRRYPERSDDEENPEWCLECHSYKCSCWERDEEDKRRDHEELMDYLYDEALDEDRERTRDVEQEAQQAQWDAEIAEWEESQTSSNEFYASFSEF